MKHTKTSKSTTKMSHLTCFHPSTTTTNTHAAPPTTTNPNITTSLYQTHLGIFSLTWSHSFLSKTFHLQLHHPSLFSPSFYLTLKPFLFWKKQGIKELPFSPTKSIWIFWDLTNARFGSGPEPESGFYIAVLSQGEMTLLVGDMDNEAYGKTRVKKGKNKKEISSLALKREHIVSKNKFYTTRTNLGGKTRIITIELNETRKENPRLSILFDQKKVLQVKHLKWKFRGNERIEVDGHEIQVSWDVHNLLFDKNEEKNQEDGYALFTFRFEKQGNFETGEEREDENMWLSQDYSCGLNYEKMKMKKKLMAKSRTKVRSPSFSSSSISSVSSSCGSVLEWESVEENELKGPIGFSLLVYAWKS